MAEKVIYNPQRGALEPIGSFLKNFRVDLIQINWLSVLVSAMVIYRVT
jgi:hypothetical protein